MLKKTKKIWFGPVYNCNNAQCQTNSLLLTLGNDRFCNYFIGLMKLGLCRNFFTVVKFLSNGYGWVVVSKVRGKNTSGFELGAEWYFFEWCSWVLWPTMFICITAQISRLFCFSFNFYFHFFLFEVKWSVVVAL